MATYYFDNSATTRPYDMVIDLMAHIMSEEYGNPSSLHRMGMEAEGYVRTAREQVAKAMGASPEEIYFTSGGSESDNTAIFGGAYKGRRQGRKILTSCIEHPAVLESFARLKEEGFYPCCLRRRAEILSIFSLCFHSSSSLLPSIWRQTGFILQYLQGG